MSRLILITGAVGTQKYRFAKNLVTYLNQSRERAELVSMHETFVKLCNEKSFTSSDEYTICRDNAVAEIVEKIKGVFMLDATAVCVGEFDKTAIDMIATKLANCTNIVIAIEAEDCNALSEHIINVLHSETFDFPELCRLYADDVYEIDDNTILQMSKEFSIDLSSYRDALRLPNVATDEFAFYKISQLVRLYHNRNPTE